MAGPTVAQLDVFFSSVSHEPFFFECVIIIVNLIVSQGCRRVFKSGAAEEAIECRRHERGYSTRGGIIPPLDREFGGLPEKIVEF